MADETPVVEGAPAPSTESASAEPQAAEWEYNGRESVNQLANAVNESHQTDRLLQELAGRPEITVSELRQLPGTEGMSDEQLMQMWQEASTPKQDRPRDEQGRFTKAQQEAQGQAAGAKPGAVQRAWKALTAEGVEVADLAKMTGQEILSLQFEYQANGKPQRKTFDEVIRNAQLGHYNSERMREIQTQRDTSVSELRQARETLQALEQDKQTWLTAMAAAARQDFGPLETLLKAFVDASNAPPQPTQQDMVPRAEIERERYGQQVYQTTVVPKAAEIANKYGLSPDEVAQGIMMIVEHEPPEFFTMQRLQQIMDHDIVYAIENMQREHPTPAATPDPREAKIAELEAQLAEARKAKAGQHNQHIQDVHQRRRTAPPAQSGMPGSAGGIESPNFDSAQGAREWLRSL